MRVHVPPALWRYAGDREVLELPGANVSEVLAALQERYPELGRHVLQADGRPRSYLNVYVNDTDIRALEHLRTPLGETDTLTLVPSIAGG